MTLASMEWNEFEAAKSSYFFFFFFAFLAPKDIYF